MSGSPQGSAEAVGGTEHAAGDWAKTVADGAAGAGPPPAAPLGNVTPDEVLDATPAEPQNDDVVNVTEAAGAADPVDGVGDVPGDAVPDSSAPDDN
ncbi:MAG: hypothetical protein AAF531_18710 [Actinomycetota bacterium]